MANKILLEILNADIVKKLDNTYSGGVLEIPLSDDLTISAESRYSTLGELVPIIDTIKNKAMSFLATTSNTISGGAIELANKFDVPRWQKTDPFKINFKAMFYTKDDPFHDVFLPTTSLQSLAILTKTDNGNYITPGISLQTMKAFGQRRGSAKVDNVLRKSKLVALEIPGIIYLPLAFVRSVVPVWSKEVTEKGYPLWAMVDIQLESVLPASDEAYSNVLGGAIAKRLESSTATDKQSLSGLRKDYT